MEITDIKQIIELSNDLSIDARELFNNINDEEIDFEVDNYRFIAADEIDEIQQNELGSDLYMLGCFTAEFIADNTSLSYNVVKALQKAEAFEELGELMVDHIEDLQSEYARLDGYGHHFAHYDHNENEIELNGINYYYFRVN